MMVVHSSLDSYLARTLKEFLCSDAPKMKQEVGWGVSYHASYNDGVVISTIANIGLNVRFETIEGVTHYSLEARTEKDETATATGKMTVLGAEEDLLELQEHWKNFFQEVILPSIRKAHASSNSK